MQAVVPDPAVAPRLQDGFVALAADADEPELEVHKLSFKLKNATLLPFVLVADAEGRFLGGHSGGIEAPDLARLLQEWS